MKILVFVLIFFSSTSFAESLKNYNFETGEYQTHVLELYTSEGCSSCPPAEAWLGSVNRADFKRHSILPLAFHVTYWDYIGWKDLFAKKQFDQRQRQMVLQEGGRTVYTPQFFINSTTKRGITSAIEQMADKGKRPSQVKIKSHVESSKQQLKVKVDLKKLKADLDDVVRVSVVAYENGIRSVIEAGENEGRIGQHQYVVREMQTALVSLEDIKNREFVFNRENKSWSGLAIILESQNKVIEALDMPL